MKHFPGKEKTERRHDHGNHAGEKQSHAEHLSDGVGILFSPVLAGENGERRGKPEMDDIENKTGLAGERTGGEGGLRQPSEHYGIRELNTAGNKVLNHDRNDQNQKIAEKPLSKDAVFHAIHHIRPKEKRNVACLATNRAEEGIIIHSERRGDDDVRSDCRRYDRSSL